MSNILNFINNNFVGGKFVITLINIFGSFSGKIVPPNQPLPNSGGPTSSPNAATSVDLPKNQPIVSNTSQSGNGSSATTLAAVSTAKSVSQLLQEGGKLLSDAASTQNLSKQVNKVINQPSASQNKFFQLNYILLGIILLVLAGYVYFARRKA